VSRSRHKMPIISHTKCREPSARTRSFGTSAGALICPWLEIQASHVWTMGKESRACWPVAHRLVVAERRAHRKERNPQERASLKQRLLHNGQVSVSVPEALLQRVLAEADFPWLRPPSFCDFQFLK
jgi:hypothetical protein